MRRRGCRSRWSRWAVVWVLAARGIKVTTGSLLVFEGISLLLILALVA